MAVRRVNVSIDTLVLRGFRAADRQPLAEGFRMRLMELLADPAIASRLGAGADRTTLSVGRVEIRGHDGARSVGAAAARQLVTGLKGEKS